MRKAFPLVLSVLFLVFVTWLVWSSAQFQNCIQISQGSSFIGIFRGCAGGFVHNNAEGIIAVFTIILALSTIFLWGATADLVHDAKDASRRQLRAYISIIPKDVMNWNNQPHRVGVQIHIKNHGRTPGFNIRYNFSMLVLDNPLPTNFVWPATDLHWDQNNTVFPDEVLPARFFLHRDLTQPERIDIEAGTKRLELSLNLGDKRDQAAAV
jgi:hypothetical protein